MEQVWVISFHCVQVTNYYSHDTPRPLLCDVIDFSQWPEATMKPIHPASCQRWSMNVTCCEAKGKAAVEQANVVATINHTSVVSWMHTNLYVLDLCGRSNLTKIHTSPSSRSQAVINENYLHKSKWASEKKRGDRAGGHGEMTNRWWETVVRGGRGIEKRATTWFTIRRRTSERAFTKSVHAFTFDMAFVAQHSEFKVLNQKWMWTCNKKKKKTARCVLKGKRWGTKRFSECVWKVLLFIYFFLFKEELKSEFKVVELSCVCKLAHKPEWSSAKRDFQTRLSGRKEEKQLTANN